MNYEILGSVNSPSDIKKLNNEQLNKLCEEGRDLILEVVSKNGGHLASNLGAVELTVALHRAFNSPEDAIIFDVGHQCYMHKLLTGRFDRFSTLRKSGGIAGFMRPDESEHDPFITGHSSNSISAAYGIFKSKQINGENGTAVAVIGDGAMTGGMAFEALNNASQTSGNFIIVINDNTMSISRNVGGMASAFSKLRNRPRYHRFKFKFGSFLLDIPLIGKPVFKVLESIKNWFKGLVYRNNIFTAMGYNYLGPVDGHSIVTMEELFKVAKLYDKPSVIHVITKKGKGYSFAENEPKNYHGVSPFDIEKGVVVTDKITYSDVVGKTLCELAEENSKICAITAAMKNGTGIADFADKFRDRFFDVGIAEQHAVTFSAGLAKGGVIPYFAVYSSFLQRAYDQIIHDCAIADLPLKLLIDRAGIVGEDGETHQGIFDVSFLSSIPNMNIYSPSSYNELIYLIKRTSQTDELCAIRYPRGSEGSVSECDFSEDYTLIKKNSSKLLITYGRLFSESLSANLSDIDVLKLNRIFPIGKEVINIINGYDEVNFFEEGIKAGGIAEKVGSMLCEINYCGKYRIYAIDNFVPASDTYEAFKNYKIDGKSMELSFKTEDV